MQSDSAVCEREADLSDELTDEMKRQVDKILDDLVDLSNKYMDLNYDPRIIESAFFSFASRIVLERGGLGAYMKRNENVVRLYLNRGTKKNE